MILLLLLMAGCGNDAGKSESEAESAIVESETVKQPDIEAPLTDKISEPEVIYMENPSWDYFCGQDTASAASSLELVKLTEVPNGITDTEKWFAENDLSLEAETDERYNCEIFSSYNGEECYIQVIDTENGETFILDFSDYQYAKDFVPEEEAYVKQIIRYAEIKDGILYFSIGHLTYAQSSPHNAYVAAVDLTDKELLWKSQPLVSNANNFVIQGDILLCGYGFTEEPDYLYQLDLSSGQVIDQLSLKSMAEYLILKNDILYVRTYNTNYTFQVNE